MADDTGVGTGNSGREAGRVEATLDAIIGRLERIEHKLDGVADWKGIVDARLATGAERFRNLENRDNISTITASIIGTIAAVISGIISELRR